MVLSNKDHPLLSIFKSLPVVYACTDYYNNHRKCRKSSLQFLEKIVCFIGECHIFLMINNLIIKIIHLHLKFLKLILVMLMNEFIELQPMNL
jgi:hypothetical protein